MYSHTIEPRSFIVNETTYYVTGKEDTELSEANGDEEKLKALAAKAQ